MLAVGVVGGRVTLVDEASGEVKWAEQARSREFCSARVAMSPSGRFVASVGSKDRQWKLLDATSGTVHRVGARHDGSGACICNGHPLVHQGCPVIAHTSRIHALAFSPGGQRLATGGENGAVILWDAHTGKAEQVMHSDSRGISSLSFSANGERLASGGWNGCVCVWNARGVLLRTMTQASCSGIFWVQFSPSPGQSHTLLTAGYDRMHFWDVDSGEIVRSFAGSMFAVFSPDGHSIASAGAPGSQEVLVVDAETGALRFRMLSHTQEVSSASWSIDGRKLASCSYDGTCKVWDSSTGALLRTFTLQKPVFSVSWGCDWVRDAVAFAMGQHPRLGAGSPVFSLEVGVVRMILDRVV